MTLIFFSPILVRLVEALVNNYFLKKLICYKKLKFIYLYKIKKNTKILFTSTFTKYIEIRAKRRGLHETGRREYYTPLIPVYFVFV